MIFIEIDENKKAKVDLRGNLGIIYSELALAVKLIADNEELEIGVDDILELIRDSIDDEVKINVTQEVTEE